MEDRPQAGQMFGRHYFVVCLGKEVQAKRFIGSASFFARAKHRKAFLGLSLLHNPMETLATQVKDDTIFVWVSFLADQLDERINNSQHQQFCTSAKNA